MLCCGSIDDRGFSRCELLTFPIRSWFEPLSAGSNAGVILGPKYLFILFGRSHEFDLACRSSAFAWEILSWSDCRDDAFIVSTSTWNICRILGEKLYRLLS